MSDAEDVPEEFEGRYVTQAIESTVRDERQETIGHVGLIDADGATEREAIRDAYRLPGPVAVLQSSEESYHLWALAVDALEAWLTWSLALGTVDDQHVALSEKRDCGVVRLAEKVSVATGTIEKPAPELVEMIEGEDDRPLSRPHAELLIEEFGADLDLEADRGWVGDSAPSRTFMADLRTVDGGAD